MKFISAILFFILIQTSIFGQKQVEISGYCPEYVGKTINIYSQDDFITSELTLLTSTIGSSDSTFSAIIEVNEIRKIVVKSNNNQGFIYVEPGSNYELFLPGKDKYEPSRPNGNKIEIGFYNLDSSDINFKTIDFQFELDDFLGNNFHLRRNKPLEFAQAVDSFKLHVTNKYMADTSMYFKTFVRFSIAGIDNIQTATERNPFEKYDFYLKRFPVSYHNEPYMEYVKSFYKNLIHRVNNETNQKVYESVLKSSPTLMMHALGKEYTLSNPRLREIVMILILKDEYMSKEYPETNVINILDSLSNKSIFKEHEIIASNLKKRLITQLPGSKALDFVLKDPFQEVRTLGSFKGKHLYIHFFDPQSTTCNKELPLLIELHEKYGDIIQFVTLYKTSRLTRETDLSILPWIVYGLTDQNKIWEFYQVETFPFYSFIDSQGYIIASPSLSPSPNGVYETIDRSFFQLNKLLKGNQN